MTDNPPQDRHAPKPFVLEVAEDADPAAVPAVPDGLPEGQAILLAGQIVTARPSRLWRLALWAFGALFTLVLSVAAWDFAVSLMARSPVFGWVAVGIIGLAVLAALALAFREWAAYARLLRMDGFRLRAAKAVALADLALARRVVENLVRLYATRADTAWGRASLAEREADVMDADALISLAESNLLAPLDAQSVQEVEAAVARVATVTALVPMALADVAVALYSNLRMVRRIAEIYGGRSGSFGSLGLLRRVFSSLLAAGAMALADDLVGSVAGGGVLSKLSRRFGEGVVNGALTARIGVAAIEMCRPLPFAALPRPKVSALVARALKGLISRGGAQA
jgi:putative membrane protein